MRFPNILDVISLLARSGKPGFSGNLRAGVARHCEKGGMASMTQYVGILDGNGKTCGVRILDLPGCNGAGRSPEAALSDAVSAAHGMARSPHDERRERRKRNAPP